MKKSVGISLSIPTPRPEVDAERAARAVRELLLALGEDPSREGLEDTPRRVAEMYRALFAGRFEDPAEILSRTFAEPSGELVLVRDIEVASTCEHHLLPFVGTAHVAYVPGERVVGLSKLVRLVDAFARRPQVQERMTQQIADAMDEHLGAAGVLVAVRAEHFCMRLRGVRKAGSSTWTVASRGSLRDDDRARAEALALIRQA